MHWADEPSLLVLRHLVDQIDGARLLVLATFRDVEPAAALPGVLPDLLRSPAAQRLDLRGFVLGEVREQLSTLTADGSVVDADTIFDVTDGNPLFVREVARAMADGTWRADRPPRTVLDVVGARLNRASNGCRRLVQTAAIVGRDFSLALVVAALGERRISASSSLLRACWRTSPNANWSSSGSWLTATSGCRCCSTASESSRCCRPPCRGRGDDEQLIAFVPGDGR